MKSTVIVFFFTVSNAAYPMLAALTAVRVRPVANVTQLRYASDGTKKPDHTQNLLHQKLTAELPDDFERRLLDAIKQAYTKTQAVSLCVISDDGTTNQLIVAKKRQGDQSDVQKGSRVEEGCFLQNGVVRHEMMRRVVTKNGEIIVQEFVIHVKKK